MADPRRMDRVDPPPSPASRIAVFGGVYSNHLALEAVLADARACGAEQIYCLGDVGGFGPRPDRSVEILRDEGVLTIQGNYDDSVGHGLGDCQCGYTDPRDNHYAQISYDYTLTHTSETSRAWLRALPRGAELAMGGRRIRLAHGSPRRVNEFLWESTTPRPFIRRLLEESDADLVFVTHTGIPWMRDAGEDAPERRGPSERPRLLDPLCHPLAPSLSRGLVNVGAIGRPANDGDVRVWYALVSAGGSTELAGTGACGGACEGVPEGVDEGLHEGVREGAREVAASSSDPLPSPGSGLTVELRRVGYDHERLAAEMRSEHLPEEFVETLLTGWWTTCLEVLPVKERARGRY